MRVNHRENELENHDRGLDHDLPRLLHRRGMLKLVAGASLITLAGCATTDTPARESSAGEMSEGEIPEETTGPYPGDGSNGANGLTHSGVVRSDITSSFGSSTTTAEGIPLTIAMTLQNYDQNKAYEGAAIYLWHCGREAQYSLYSEAIAHENYLRGVQEADEWGQVTFQTMYPACYSGRWPHIHFEVYPSLAQATSSGNKTATSQMALPEDVSKAVYATPGYEASESNLSQVTLASDNVFGDGYDLQLPEVTGSTGSTGHRLAFTCAV